MTMNAFAEFDPTRVPSPCYVINRAQLIRNLEALKAIGREADVRILLALKAFSCFHVADDIGRYLDGTAASGLYEARLGKTRFKGEVHTFAPGLKQADLPELLELSDHLILNSLSQYRRFQETLDKAHGCALGLRVNPGHREVDNPLYDPAAPWSRLGVPVEKLTTEDLTPFDSLHVHALCDHDLDAFARLLAAFEDKARHLFGAVEAINLGGGLLMTEEDFPKDRLVRLLTGFRARTGLAVTLEPGTAVVRHAGALVTEVLDTTRTGGNVAILDASATCHSPDIIEAPYTPIIAGTDPIGRTRADEFAGEHDVWRLGGPTCLAGDIFGTYRMTTPPRAGDRLVILDQAYYTMVKSTTFNGMPLPSIAIWDPDDDRVEVVRAFGYADFEDRLG
jgi:carboxynorspermidine decarboxylase